MRSLTILFFLFFTPLSSATVSVLIPCSECHAKFLPNLMEDLSNQSRIPDEVVISLSSVGKVPTELLAEISSTIYPFELILVTTSWRKSAGENRNLAFEASSGELLIFQDADDRPHHQRVEILERCYEEFECDYMIHRWFPEDVAKERFQRSEDEAYFKSISFEDEFDVSSLPVVQIQSYEELFPYTYLTFGCVAVSRDLQDAVSWTFERWGEDKVFSSKAIPKSRNSIYVKIPLLLYRRSNSSYHR